MVPKPGKGLPLISRHSPSPTLRIEGSTGSKVLNPTQDTVKWLCTQLQSLVTTTFHSGIPFISLPLLVVPIVMLFKEHP